MKTITYKDWNSVNDTTIDCTADHNIMIKSSGVKAWINKFALVWYTRCDRRELRAEIKDLKWDAMIAELYEEVLADIGKIPPPAMDVVRNCLTRIFKQWAVSEQRDDQRAPTKMHEALKTSTSSQQTDDATLLLTLEDIMHSSMDDVLEHMAANEEDIEDELTEVFDLDDIEDPRPRKFRKLSSLPSSHHTSDLTHRSSQPVRASSPPPAAEQETFAPRPRSPISRNLM